MVQQGEAVSCEVGGEALVAGLTAQKLHSNVRGQLPLELQYPLGHLSGSEAVLDAVEAHYRLHHHPPQVTTEERM